jgi:hypothetical protein
MTALYRLHSGSWQRSRTDKRYRLPTGIPFGDAFPNGEISPFTCWSLNYGSKFPLFSGELALARSREARVSRLIGNFDTTASERKWQVAILALLWEVPR